LVVEMICRSCGDVLGYEFRSGLFVTGICLRCGDTSNRLRII
jgi:hypothetical protein